ncbi:hypothetical protein Bca4012_072701 [Brassica carinata]|uniref:Uncharacterized protein n=3 Tax=Brassica TaxID=3705 RepID=A0A0D3CFL3_BRAOL|nr:unnamed protein product [Brassica napus]CDY57729.1 BnaCnng32290D [Brassica napus]VDD44752.1 unnamed protein product [Brassica oleracea]
MSLRNFWTNGNIRTKRWWDSWRSLNRIGSRLYWSSLIQSQDPLGMIYDLFTARSDLINKQFREDNLKIMDQSVQEVKAFELLVFSGLVVFDVLISAVSILIYFISGVYWFTSMLLMSLKSHYKLRLWIKLFSYREASLSLK